MTLLEVDAIDTFYGDAHILHDLSIEAEEGEVVGLLGRNGAGKTTTLRSIMGLTPPRTGQIRFKGESILGLKPEQIYKTGIGYVPEDRDIFPELTVVENLIVGLDSQSNRDRAFADVFEMFPRLEERSNQKGGTLSGGEQQMLAIARTLVSSPELLLIDEPSEGLMPTLVEKMGEIITELNEQGMTVVLVEQNMSLALEVSDRVYIINKGAIEHSGPSDEVSENLEDYNEYLAV